MKQLINNAVQTAVATKVNQNERKPKKQAQKKQRKSRQHDETTNHSGGMVPVMTSGSALSDMFQRQNRGRIGRNLGILPKPSVDGMAFLKAVFAPPDFAGQGAFNGIPDEVGYPCLKYRHVFTADLTSTIKASALLFGVPAPTNNDDILIIQPPVPGVAFYWAAVSAGTEVTIDTGFTPVTYNDYQEIFQCPITLNPGAPTPAPGTPELNERVQAFRFAGNSLELICTSNAFQWTGSLTCFKGKSELTDSKTYTNAGFGTQAKVFNGLENFNNNGAVSTFVAPANLGAFMTAVDTESTFISSPVAADLFQLNVQDLAIKGKLNGCFTGLGNLETNYIRMQGTRFDDENTTFMLRIWSSLEYTPKPGTVLYNASTPNAMHDPSALLAYRAIVQDLPVAVSYFDNDSFWKKLLNVVGKVGGALSVIPGWGTIAGAAGGLATSVANAID